MKMQASLIPWLIMICLSLFGASCVDEQSPNYQMSLVIASKQYTLPSDWPSGSGTLDAPNTGNASIALNSEQAGMLKPNILTIYTPDYPATGIPLLKWTVPPGSVYFEIEFLTDLPENPNDTKPSQYSFFASQQVFTDGYIIDLAAYPDNQFYWRVRGLDLAGKPVGVFSDAASLYIDHSLACELKPAPNTGYQAANMPMPLYPVYAWIPIPGAVKYEVELTFMAPENPNGIDPSVFAIRRMAATTITDCYDETSLSTPGTYYWRVRGLDYFGDPIGVFSDAEEFLVTIPEGGVYAATLGDSITHGGGGISYSPACVEYDYQRYLSFPTLNLGRSGDTAETMLGRFETDVLPFQPQYLIVMDGTNSLRGGVPAEDVIRELAGISDKCAIYGIRPIFLTLPPINPESIKRAFDEETAPDWPAQFAEVNDFIRQQEYYIDIAVPEFYDADGKLPPQYGIDGMHMDIEGKKLMAKIINENWWRVISE